MKLEVGNKVRAIQACHGWASVRKGDEGLVVEVGFSYYRVDFPTHGGWQASECCVESIGEPYRSSYKSESRALIIF